MIEVWLAVVIIAALGVAALAYWGYASRLDRLHRKVEASKIGLETQLVSRCALAEDLALGGELDPASSFALAQVSSGVQDQREQDSRLVAGEVDAARLGDLLTPSRLARESELSQVLREVFSRPDDATSQLADEQVTERVEALAGAWYRVQLARRFHNEAVAQTQAVRSKLLVRWLRMAGSAPWPYPVDFDDVSPATLLGRIAQSSGGKN